MTFGPAEQSLIPKEDFTGSLKRSFSDGNNFCRGQRWKILDSIFGMTALRLAVPDSILTYPFAPWVSSFVFSSGQNHMDGAPWRPGGPWERYCVKIDRGSPLMGQRINIYIEKSPNLLTTIYVQY